MNQPPLGLTVKGKLLRSKDGDTVTIEVTKQISVRIMGDDGRWFNTPELKSKDAQSRLLAEQARDAAKEYEGKEVVLFIPASERDNLSDDFSLSRVLGKVFVDGKDWCEIFDKFNIGKVK